MPLIHKLYTDLVFPITSHMIHCLSMSQVYNYSLTISFTLQNTLLSENIYKVIHMKDNFEREKKLHSNISS